MVIVFVLLSLLENWESSKGFFITLFHNGFYDMGQATKVEIWPVAISIKILGLGK